ncbi:hypothetical protein KIW84_051872 [Lathyrus oleraceus]|uniref:Gag-Pol polyprotein n=1 Tax=Pisum sativum TaxID=3888 RepID=A0A9D4WNH9_PEA|nr:hypothetical protein KIW84_051872 [Pisum sativum]
MTFDAADFSERSTPRRSSIANANGGLSAVTGAGTVMLSPSLSLSNTLLVPSLSHKLLSGETPEEESNWSTFDWFKDIDIPSTEVFGDSCQTQTDHMSPEVEVSEFPPSPVLNDPSPENSLRHNRGKPPKRYSPEEEDHRSRYPIANYVSMKDLSEPLKKFAKELSSYSVPSNVEEAIEDPRWVQAMNEEMEALNKNATWTLVPLPKGKKPVGFCTA